MKRVLFAGVALALVAGSVPGFAAPASAPQAATAPHVQQPITFAQVKAVADKLWDRMDVNHDGKIDAADHDARLLERFARWDTNHDGVISKDEFLAFVHAREAQWHDHGPDHGPDGPPPPPPGEAGWHKPGHEGKGPDRLIAMAIVMPALHRLHKDGIPTRAAFDAAVKARFDALDANHDGALTHEELRAAWHGGWRHGQHHHMDHHDWDHPGEGGPHGHEWRHHDGDAPPPPPPPPAAQ